MGSGGFLVISLSDLLHLAVSFPGSTPEITRWCALFIAIVLTRLLENAFPMGSIKRLFNLATLLLRRV